MKKVIIALAVIFASCTKQPAAPPPPCYECEYGTVQGYQKPADVFCGDITTYHPKYQGNDIQTFCKLR